MGSLRKLAAVLALGAFTVLPCHQAMAGNAVASGAPVGTPTPDDTLRFLLPGAPAAASAAPKGSDVVFSPRFDRPEAVAVARDFGATRIEWSYITNPLSVAALRKVVGPHWGGAINNNAPTPDGAGAAIDFDGKPIVAPWMKSWGAIWNTCAAPETMEAIKQWIDRNLAAGATSIQFDDAGMQYDSSFWGVGDFSDASLRGFGAWVEKRVAAGEAMPLTPKQAANYRDWLRDSYKVRDNADCIARSAQFPSTAVWRAYLKETVSNCLTDIRAYLLARSNRAVALSVNAYSPLPWGTNAFQVDFADFIVSEAAADHSDFHHLAFMSAWLAMEGKRWAPVFPIADKALLRTRIATAYAVGGNPVIPWDVFIPPTTKAPATRFSATASEFADLFKFVRANASLFDGWETLSRLNLIVYADPVNITQTFAQLKRLADAQVPYTPYLHRAAMPPRNMRNQAGVNASFRAGSSKGITVDTQPLLAEVSDASLSAYAAASTETAGARVVVKANMAVPGGRVIHLLDPDAGSRTSPTTISISAWALGPSKSFAVRLYGPAEGAFALGKVSRLADGTLKLTIPKAASWWVFVLDPL